MTFLIAIRIAGLAGLGYLLGSVPWGLVITRMLQSGDILSSGSGNIGANNVRRIAGTMPALLTLFLDAAKGAVPVYIADVITRSYGNWNAWAISLIALCAFLGHLYPLYMGFKNGGKGVATAAGCFAVISPAATGAAIVVYIVCVYLTRRSSVGSLASATFLPFAVQIAERSPVLTASALFMAVMIWVRHTDNIRRLIGGNEPPI